MTSGTRNTKSATISARGAVQLSSQSVVPTSPATASQMPRYGAEPEQVPAISKAQAGGHCVTRRTLMNIAISAAALVTAPSTAVADHSTDADAELLSLRGRIFEIYEKAHEHDDEMERLQAAWMDEYKRATSSGLSKEQAWDHIKQLPESAEHSRLVKLTDPFHSEIERLVTVMMSVPAQTPAGKATKAEVLIYCVMGLDWLQPEANADWDVRFARKLLLEFIGGKSAAELQSRFAEPAVA